MAGQALAGTQWPHKTSAIPPWQKGDPNGIRSLTSEFAFLRDFAVIAHHAAAQGRNPNLFSVSQSRRIMQFDCRARGARRTESHFGAQFIASGRFRFTAATLGDVRVSDLPNKCESIGNGAQGPIRRRWHI
jgi:hypothetical protein